MTKIGKHSESISRIAWVDYMKAFSIMAVVLNHTHLTAEVKAYVYLICLPAFFFTAGIFTHPQRSFKSFAVHQTKRLLVPYLLWSGILWLIWLLVARKYGNYTEATLSWWYPLKGMLLGKSDFQAYSPLWFLCCLMSVEWMYYFIYKIPQKWLRWLVILISGTIGCLLSCWQQNWIWEISAALIILPLYGLGAEYGKKIQEKAKTCGFTSLVFILCISLIGVWIGAKYNAGIGLHTSYIGKPYVYYPSIVAVIGMWGSISLLLDRYFGSARILSFIGQNTLFILCAHIPVFGIIKGIAILCHLSLDFFETGLGCLCLWAGSFVILIPAAYIVNRYLPWTVGKKKLNP